MKILHMRFDITPTHFDVHSTTVCVNVQTEKGEFSLEEHYPTDHFKSLFSRFMRNAEIKIQQLMEVK